MTCRSIRKHLPLAAGGDLPDGKAKEVAAHLKTCAACRAELDAYRSALVRARELDDAAGQAWNDAAWAKAVRRAVDQGSTPAASRPKLILRPAAIAVAGVVLIAVVALFLVLTRHPLQPREVLEARTEEAKTVVPAAVEPKPESSPGAANKPDPRAKARDIARVNTERRFPPRFENQGLAPRTYQKIVKRDLKIEPEAPLLAAGRIKPSPAPIDRALTGATPSPVSSSPSQDVVSAVFVSQETGLKIVWFFDRNFDWKGEIN